MNDTRESRAEEIDLWPAWKRGDAVEDPAPGRDLSPSELGALVRSLPRHFRPDVADWVRRAVESYARP